MYSLYKSNTNFSNTGATSESLANTYNNLITTSKEAEKKQLASD